MIDDDDNDDSTNVSKFETLYSIRMQMLSLREIMIFSSLTKCKSSRDILNVVQDNIFPASFYKSSLDFEGANMLSLLTFDSRSMHFLL
jgi:hypothetical protein